MASSVEDVASRIGAHEGASEAVLERLEEWAKGRVPDTYFSFLRRCNGAEGLLSPAAYVALWRAEDVAELNSGYAVDEFAPGLVLFGTDGGDTGYAFDSRDPASPVVEVPLMGMDLEEVKEIAGTLDAFFEVLTARR